MEFVKGENGMAVNESSREAFREQRKLEKVERKDNEKGTAKKEKRIIRIRLIPIWLRVIIVAILIFASAIAGAAVGYGMLGGENPSDVFQKSTWTYIIDLVEKE